MTLMSDNGDIREDLRVPDSDVGKEIEAKFEAGDDFMVSVQYGTEVTRHLCRGICRSSGFSSLLSEQVRPLRGRRTPQLSLQ